MLCSGFRAGDTGVRSEVEAYFEILVLLHLHRHTHTVEYSAIYSAIQLVCRRQLHSNRERLSGADPSTAKYAIRKEINKIVFHYRTDLYCTCFLMLICQLCFIYVNSLPFLCRLVSLRRRYAPVDAERPHFRRFEYAFGLVRWPTPIYTVHYNMYTCEFIKIFFFSSPSGSVFGVSHKEPRIQHRTGKRKLLFMSRKMSIKRD